MRCFWGCVIDLTEGGRAYDVDRLVNCHILSQPIMVNEIHSFGLIVFYFGAFGIV